MPIPHRLSLVFIVCTLLLLTATDGARAQQREDHHRGADYLYEWNEVLFAAVREINRFDREYRPRTSGDNPPRTSRAMAMVHGAMYDAVNGITGESAPYRMMREDDNPASVRAALMEAAYVVMNGLFGEEGSEIVASGIESNTQNAINSRRTSQLVDLIDRIDAGELTEAEMAAGREWGKKVGEAMLEWRADDGSQRQVNYDDQVEAYGKYRMDTWTPDAASRAAEPGWGKVDLFALEGVEQFRVPGPPALDSERWQKALKEVRDLGRRDRYDPERYGGELPEEVAYQWRTAFFWSEKGLDADGAKNNHSTLTPPGRWTKIAQSVAREEELSLDQAVRLFALLSIANADATIVCWHYKFHYELWRPIHAVRWDHDEQSSDPDADWIPLLPTSMHPEYVSGHSTASGASAAVLAGFFGTDEMTFSATGDDAIDDEVRTFSSFSEAAEEAGRSRIYGGIHYQFANEHGLDLGREVGHYVLRNFLRR